MIWKPRPIEPEELDAAIDLGAVVFAVGPRMPDDYRRQLQLLTELDRTFVVDDGDVLAGMAGAYSLDLTLPGGGTVAMAGVTDVGVLPTHRRRGILRALMAAVLDQAIERGEPVAGLTASEGGIYRRFGYGVATRYHRIVVDRARSAEVVDVAAPGQLRMIGEAEAETVLPQVWTRHRLRRAGEVERSLAWWQAEAIDPEGDRDGASPRFVVVHEDGDGAPDGFAVYRLKEGAAPDGYLAALIVETIAAVDDRVEAALLRYLLDVDLVGQLVWKAPVDLGLRWRLADPRAVQVTEERDLLWLRPLDVAACLAARRYQGAGDRLVIEVVDEHRPELGGRVRLEGGAAGAECVPTASSADVVLGPAELGSLLLGGVTWGTLRRAGVIEEVTAGAADRLDALFGVERAPYCATVF